MSMATIEAAMAETPTREQWRLLIYTVPSEPSRKRAFIWRELKKAGAVYLRDGVCALPDRPQTATALESIASKIEEFGGEATLVTAVALEAKRTEAIIEASRSERRQEYAELQRDSDGLLTHVQHET